MLRRSVRAALTVAVALVFSCASRHVAACGPNPPAFWTLTAAPQPAPLVPTDGAILLLAKAWTDTNPERGASEAFNDVQAVVRDENGVEVPGTLEPWYPSHVAWRPRTPMAPHSLFHIDASVTSLVSRPATATGDTSVGADFSTGPAPAPPLRLAEPLQVTLETYDLARWKECNTCGTGCKPDGSVRALRARVTIPAAQGGYAPDGYAAWLWVTNDQPRHPIDPPGGTIVNLGGLERVPPNAALTVLRDVPTEDVPYAPCFTLRVFDPAGHFADAAPLCLPRMDVKAAINDLDRGRAAGGCSVAPAAGDVWPAWLLLYLAVRAPGFTRRSLRRTI